MTGEGKSKGEAEEKYLEIERTLDAEKNYQKQDPVYHLDVLTSLRSKEEKEQSLEKLLSYNEVYDVHDAIKKGYTKLIKEKKRLRGEKLRSRGEYHEGASEEDSDDDEDEYEHQEGGSMEVIVENN